MNGKIEGKAGRGKRKAHLGFSKCAYYNTKNSDWSSRVNCTVFLTTTFTLQGKQNIGGEVHLNLWLGLPCPAGA